MQSPLDNIEALYDKSKEYMETQMELFRLKAINKSTTMISSLATRLIYITVFLIGLFLLNIALGFWLGELLGKVYYGFFCLAAFYFIVGLIIFAIRKNSIGNPIRNALIDKFDK